MQAQTRRVAVIGGNRIPFARSNTVYAGVSNQEMLTAAIDGVDDWARADATPTWTAYNHAMYDWFHPPQIGCLAQEDGYILVEARDDVLVTKVQVTVLDGEGCVLVTGEAVRVGRPAVGVVGSEQDAGQHAIGDPRRVFPQLLDPGQGLPMFSGEELLEFVRMADAIVRAPLDD